MRYVFNRFKNCPPPAGAFRRYAGISPPAPTASRDYSRGFFFTASESRLGALRRYQSIPLVADKPKPGSDMGFVAAKQLFQIPPPDDSEPPGRFLRWLGTPLG